MHDVSRRSSNGLGFDNNLHEIIKTLGKLYCFSSSKQTKQKLTSSSKDVSSFDLLRDRIIDI